MCRSPILVLLITLVGCVESLSTEKGSPHANALPSTSESRLTAAIPSSGESPPTPELLPPNSIEAFRDRVDQFVLSPDGSLIATWDKKSNIRLWDYQTHQQRPFVMQVKALNCMSVSADNRHLAIATDQEMQILDIETSKVIQSYPVDMTSSIAFGPEDNSVISFVRGITIFDRTTGRRSRLAKEENNPNIMFATQIAFSPQRQLAAVAFEGQLSGSRIDIYELETQNRINIVHVPESVLNSSFSPDGKFYIAACTKQGFLFNAETWDQIKVLDPPDKFYPVQISASKDGSTVCWISDQSMYSLDVADGTKKVISPARTNSAEFCTDGSLIFVDSLSGKFNFMSLK